jgi:hypothetical protein
MPLSPDDTALLALINVFGSPTDNDSEAFRLDHTPFVTGFSDPPETKSEWGFLLSMTTTAVKNLKKEPDLEESVLYLLERCLTHILATGREKTLRMLKLANLLTAPQEPPDVAHELAMCLVSAIKKELPPPEAGKRGAIR